MISSSHSNTNSTIRFGGLITTISEPEPIETWNFWAATYSWRPIQTWVVLPEGYDKKDLEQKLPTLMEQYMGAEIQEKNTYHLQPLTRVYLYTKTDYNLDWFSDINRIYTFTLVAIFILLIACINFMNLATARSVHRAREVGMRKVVGAYRKQLISQFLGESMFLAFLALPLAFGLAQIALPAFASYIGSNITTAYLDLIPAFIVFAIIVGLLAGSYPAFYLSTYRPVEVLKGSLKSGTKGAWFRKGLVVFQFGASIVLIIGTAVVYNQLSYLSNKDLGFDKDQMVMVPIFFYAIAM